MYGIVPQSKTVEIVPLKKFVIENLPTDSALRDVILSDNDMLSIVEFLAESRVWLTLLRREGSR
jgi:hypothetical protein